MPVLNNPHFLSDDDLRRYFILRKDLLDSQIANLRLEKPLPKLFSGMRGMGKTTLLRRIALEIRQEPDLAARYFPLEFAEEQYTVARAADFWLNVLTSIEDAFRERGDKASARRVKQLREVFGPRPDADDVEEAVLKEADALQRRLVLLVDNAERVLEQVEGGDAKRLGKTLAKDARMLFLGATTNPTATVFDPQGPFGALAQRVNLNQIGLDEVRVLMARVAEIESNAEVKRWLETDQPARLATLHTLAGGNPRTLGYLYRYISRGQHGTIQQDLDGLIDEISPLYKARFEEHSPQAQKILSYLADAWPRALTARELEQKAEVINTTSAQLARALDSEFVVKHDVQAGKRDLFRLSENLFAIWLIMRLNRSGRSRLHAYAEALRLDATREEMERDAREMVRAHKAGEGVDPDSARIYVEAMEPSALRSELIRTHRKWNSEGRVVEVEKGVLESWLDQATQLQNVGDHIRALEVCQDRLLDYPEDYWALSKQAWSYLEMSRYGESEPLFRRAAELAERAGDHHQASREYNNLGLTLWRQKKTVRAEAEFRLAIREAKRAGDHALAAIARSNLGVSLWKPGTEEEAVKEFRLAIGEAECAGDDAAAVQSHFNLGASLGLQGKWEQAEEEFRRAIELNPAFMKAALGLFDVLVHRLRERGWESVTAGVVELLDHTKGAEAIQLSGFLPAVVQTRHTKELLDLLEVADVGGEWMLVREALKGVDDPASVERLVPEVRERVRALVAEITGKAAR